MKKLLLIAGLAIAAAVPMAASAHTDVSIGFNLGLPVYAYAEPVYQPRVVYREYEPYTVVYRERGHGRWCPPGHRHAYYRDYDRGYGWGRRDDDDDDDYRGHGDRDGWRGGHHGHR